MDAEHAEVLGYLVHGKRAGGRLGIDQDLAPVGIDELAGDTRRLLGLALRVPDDHLDLAAAYAASSVDLLHLHPHGISG